MFLSDLMRGHPVFLVYVPFHQILHFTSLWRGFLAVPRRCEDRRLRSRSVGLSRSGIQFRWLRATAMRHAQCGKLNFTILDPRSLRASRASPTCRSPHVRERSRASRSRCPSRFLPFWLYAPRATFSCATSSRGSSFFDPPSAISADGGDTQHRPYHASFTTGCPHLSHVAVHTSELIEWIMHGCPVKSSGVRCGCSARTLRSPSC